MKSDSLNTILVSIIMATYNSEKTIEKSLFSIREQSINQNLIEILVVDGFSTDNTRKIAEKYYSCVIDNPERLPEPAKRLGIQMAKGKYVLIMDSDEVFPNKTILERRINFLEKHNEIYCLLAGHTAPNGFSPCAHYISNVGDPFSAFVYNWYLGGNVGLVKRKKVSEDNNGYVGYFKNGDIIPIGDSVTMMNREYILAQYGTLIKTENTATLFHKLVEDTHYVGHIKGDYLFHYTRSDIKTYFNKLKFRVINNIFDIKGSGFSARQEIQSKKSLKKYFYPLYCLFFIFPVIDSLRMMFYYKHPIYLLHPIFAWYVMFEIFLQYTKKIFGKRINNKQYG